MIFAYTSASLCFIERVESQFVAYLLTQERREDEIGMEVCECSTEDSMYFDRKLVGTLDIESFVGNIPEQLLHAWDLKDAGEPFCLMSLTINCIASS